MTFCKPRKNLGQKTNDNEYELLRFCNKLNTIIIGGANKMFKQFIKDYNPNSVISYADRRWNTGKVYEKMGFEREQLHFNAQGNLLFIGANMLATLLYRWRHRK